MCEICRQHPCHPQCPNYEPEVVTYCRFCKIPICKGERYYDLPDTVICLDCGIEYLEQYKTRAEVTDDAEF